MKFIKSKLKVIFSNETVSVCIKKLYGWQLHNKSKLAAAAVL